jgi:hypothetical protein
VADAASLFSPTTLHHSLSLYTYHVSINLVHTWYDLLLLSENNACKGASSTGSKEGIKMSVSVIRLGILPEMTGMGMRPQTKGASPFILSSCGAD